MNRDTVCVPAKELQIYETAVLASVREAHAIAGQLENEGHALSIPLKAGLHKAVMAHGSWRVAKWLGGQP